MGNGQQPRSVGRASRAAMSALPALLVLACVHRGAGWEPASPEVSDEGDVSLILLGEIAPGRTASVVAAKLDQVLTEEERAGRDPVVLWLGNSIFPAGPAPDDQADDGCTAVAQAWTKKGPASLAEVVRKHARQGVPSFAVLGDREWECGHPQLEFQGSIEDGPHPWVMPDHNYVVRVARDGSARVVSACTNIGSTQCGIEPGAPDDGTLVDLVMVDVAPWIFPPTPGSAVNERAESALAQQGALIEALRRMNPELAPPRILVSHVPIEAAGIHGQGGRTPSATFRQLPRPLRHAIRDGMFAGVVSAHDRSLQATADIGDAVKRSAKVWLESPVFQVVSGASSRPDAHAAFSPRQVGGYQGIAVNPDLYSTHAGFARIVLSAKRVDIVLHARRAGRWKAGSLSFDLRRPPHPVETTSPAMAPCLRCDPVQGAADAEKVTSRP